MRTVILDSGAFSAWSRGEVLDLDSYIEFVKANAEYIDHYVNLDVIPGSFGVIPTQAEVEASAQASWDNLLYMEREGLKPMPVFHMGESFAWLRKIVHHAEHEGGNRYVGISPANDRTTSQKRLWLDRVFTELGDADGRPRIDTHGLGITSIPLLVRYPWYSVDSSAWTTASARGVLFVPRHNRQGLPDYTQSPLVVYMSGVKPVSGEDRDFRTLDARMRKYVVDYIEAAGSTLDLCITDCKERARVCCWFFMQFEKHGPRVEVFKPHRETLFPDI